ncbi:MULTISPECIES: hypothetical protein [unclassified Thermosynechococcus]|uniref:hypothetical protein n=1 Tax=unclassified Thermosynechococcus TaxID=2622553 RepID=UPI001CECA2B6|nr:MULTISPECIES: hypothetical protein [unclassified Thermosynechococcus]
MTRPTAPSSDTLPPRIWSNRLTVAALLVAVVNRGLEWNRRNRETDRLAQAEP